MNLQLQSLRRTMIFLFVSLFVPSLVFSALLQAAEPGVVILSPATTNYPLGEKTTYLVDSKSELVVGDFQDPEVRAKFISLGAKHKNFGLTTDAHWFWVKINNPTNQIRHLKLQIYDVERVTKVYLWPFKNFSGPPKEILPDDKSYQFALNSFKIAPRAGYELLIHKKVLSNLSFNAALWDSDTYWEWETVNQFWVLPYYGALFAVLVYNLFLFISLRDRSYLEYCIFLLFMGIFQISMDGIGKEYIWPFLSSQNYLVAGYTAFFGPIMLHVLTQSLLSTQRYIPRWNRVIKSFYWYSGLVLIISPFISVHFFAILLGIAGFLTPVILIPAGILILLNANKRTRYHYYILAWLTFQLGTAVFGAAFFGYGDFYQNIVMLKAGLFFETILFSLALADRIKVLQTEKNTIQNKQLEYEKNTREYLEKQVEERTIELSKSNKAKDLFLSIIAHDLRGPIGNLSVIFNNLLSPNEKIDSAILTLVKNTTKTTHQLLENLLTWSKSQKGEIDYRPTVISMDKLMDENVNLLSSQLASKMIQLNWIKNSNLYALADYSMISTVVRNLLNNALKFTPEGGQIDITINVINDSIRWVVKDTGIGIRQSDQNKLFKIDEKLPSRKGTNNETGTGLGLILCKEFLEKNQGEIGVKSVLDQGTSFWFTLPLGKKPEVPLNDSKEKLNDLKVLLVEENQHHLQASIRTLSKQQIKPSIAKDGEEALSIVKKMKFDLILMNLDLPTLSWVETTKSILANTDPSPWIVALTSYSELEVEKLSGNLKFDGYLQKPILETEFLMTLYPLLSQD